MGDGAGDAAAGVLGHVPVLNAGEGTVTARAVVGVGGYVADGVDVAEAFHCEGFVALEGAVFFEGEVFTGLKEGGCRADADAEDDEVGGEDGAVFQVDGADGLGGGGRGGSFVD